MNKAACVEIYQRAGLTVTTITSVFYYTDIETFNSGKIQKSSA